MQIEAFVEILKEQGVRSGAGVPCSYFKPLVNQMEADPELDYLAAASEGEAVSISAGLWTAGRPAFTLMQNSGLGNAINPVTSLLYIYQIPSLLLVSQRGEPGRPDEPQHELMGRITEELARLVELRTRVLDPETFAADLRATLDAGGPGAFICRKGALEGGPRATPAPMNLTLGGPARRVGVVPFRARASREEALAALLHLLNRGGHTAPAVISTTGKLSRELYELDDRDHQRRNRFYMVGSMGCAAGFGLGVARARPERRVVVLDGDGAILMKLGTLATVGHLAPKNLHHVVMDNGAYDSTGGQPTVSPGVDLAAVALACGYRDAATVDQPDAAAETLKRQLAAGGPTLLRVLVKPGARKDLGRPRLAPRDGWRRFSSFLHGEIFDAPVS